MKKRRMTIGNTVSPTISQKEMIKSLATKLGIEVPQPRSETEAGFVIDDLLRKERERKRATA